MYNECKMINEMLNVCIFGGDRNASNTLVHIEERITLKNT